MQYTLQQIPASETAAKGFALPTILIASVVLLSVLVSAVSSTVAIRSTLQNQHYNQLAQLAGESGTVYAKACLVSSSGSVTWSEAKPLRPNTDCNGDVIPNSSPYVLEEGNVHTYFTVGVPNIDGSGIARGVTGKGYVEALRTGTGIAWRVWSSNVAMALGSSDIDKTPVGTSIEGYWATAPTGYLLEDGASYLRADYANLYNVIGTTHGVGNSNPNTFNVPDSRGRVTVNKSADTEFDTIGEKNGAKTHTHGLANNSARAQISVTGSDLIYNRVTESFAGNTRFAASGGDAGSYTGLYKTLLEGSTSDSSSLQPSIVVMRAIKY
jgi:microcystin-dependent protein